MSYRLSYPNLPDAEDYDGLAEFTGVFEAIYEEAQTYIGDHGSAYVDDPDDEEGLLAAAHEMAECAMDNLWWHAHPEPGRPTYHRFGPANEPGPLMQLSKES
jgi:hypothetical protein